MLLSACDSSLRRLRKALNAVDVIIASASSVPPLLDFSSELQTSLAVRRALAKFRARLGSDGPPTSESLRGRLRSIGTQIAILVGWDVHPELRVRDRLVMRGLQLRILAWLRGEGDASNPMGLRLWQGFVACVEMFSLVNRRQELVAHDVGVLGAAFAQRVRSVLASRYGLSNAAVTQEVDW